MKRWIGLVAFFTLFAVVLFWPSRGIFAQSGHNITLSWSASSGATSYNVKRGVSTGTEATIATSATTSFVDTTGVAGTKYFYVVTAVNQFGESGPSNEASATFLGNPPAAPAGLAVVAN